MVDKTRLTTSRVAANVPALFRLSPLAFWRFMRVQPASFWLINLYMMFEYVRPQSIWEGLAFFPWPAATLILAGVAAVLDGAWTRRWTVADVALFAFTLVLIASSFAAVRPDESFAGWGLYLNWILVYVVITNVVTTEKRVFVFTVAFLLYCLKMSQHGFRAWLGSGFSFVAWGVSGAPGWFHNSGEFGIQMCMFLPLVVEFVLALRDKWKWWLRWPLYVVPVTAVGSIIASSSRGALVGAAAVISWWVARSRHRVRSLLCASLVLSLVWILVPPEQKARFDSAGEDNTSISRLERWEAGVQMAQEYPLLGIGYNNWSSYYGPLSHNIFIEAWSELGYTGLFAFLAMIGTTFVVNARTRRTLTRVPDNAPFMRHLAYGLDGALVGYIASGFFVTVLYYPYFWVNLAMTVALNVSARTEASRYRLRSSERLSLPHRGGAVVRSFTV